MLRYHVMYLLAVLIVCGLLFAIGGLLHKLHNWWRLRRRLRRIRVGVPPAAVCDRDIGTRESNVIRASFWRH